MRHIDTRKREAEVLNLVVESYIKEYKPISSGFLCDKFHLPYSTATLRNVMKSLEDKGLLSHVHTSSGRVPTEEGFKYYVEHLDENTLLKEDETSLIPAEYFDLMPDTFSDIEGIFTRTLDALAEISGYTSLMAISGFEEKFLFRGTRFILEQPEFEDIQRLKSFFYALEVRIDEIHHLLFNYLDTKVKILIGEDIGFEEISDCSMIISGLQQHDLSAILAVLGPMRMDYTKSVSAIYSIRQKLEKALRKLL
jgi:transcriptional regulator of heat shock response